MIELHVGDTIPGLGTIVQIKGAAFKTSWYPDRWFKVVRPDEA